MILFAGEILADMIGTFEGIQGNCKMFCGGAPFNAAVNAKQAGAQVAFFGRVGDDPVGKFLIHYAEQAGFDRLSVSVDPVRNTTLAFVTLTDGERDFAFFRHDTADYHMEEDDLELEAYPNLTSIQLGSLMLSEAAGRAFADRVVEKATAAGVRLAFDVNFRMDLYKDLSEAITAYKPYVDRADVLKFSEDEILDYTGLPTLEAAAASLDRPGRLLLITLGAKGAMYRLDGKTGVIPSAPVTPVDTTGAGDAFFGTFLAKTDGKALTPALIEEALAAANEAGARATQFLGAVKL